MSINRQWKGISIVLPLIAGFIIVGWFLRDRFQPVDVASRAPYFEATDLAGNPVDLDDLRGKVVLLNVWATWCAPCREEMPSIQALYEDYAPKGLEVVAVSVDSPVGLRDGAGNPGGDVAAFAREMGLTFPIWLDPAREIYRSYRLRGVPETFILDRTGHIVSKKIGPHDWNAPEYRALFDRLLEG